MTSLEGLKAARDLIASYGWAQETLWVGDLSDLGHCRFDTVGALLVAFGLSTQPAFYGALHRLQAVVGRSDLGPWNDRSTRSIADVLRAYDQAIRQTEKEVLC